MFNRALTISTAKIASNKPTLAASSLIAKVEAAFDATYNNWPTSLHYLAQADGSVALVHAIQVQNEAINSWFEVYVDAHSGEILSTTDFVAEATVSIDWLSISRILLTPFGLVQSLAHHQESPD